MNDLILTLDVDWAPDFVVDWVTERLVDQKVRATWFITHFSPAIERLQKYPELFELGIHPNFLPGSTQGSTIDSVLRYCMNLVPEAVSMRTHGLVQSSPLFVDVVNQTPISIDVSLFLPHTPFLRPVESWFSGRKLLRIPYCWEDDSEMERPQPCWNLQPFLNKIAGLKVFDFHPIHIYLNSADTKPYSAFKKNIAQLSEAQVKDADIFIQSGKGTQTLFKEILDYLSPSNQSICIRDLQENDR